MNYRFLWVEFQLDAICAEISSNGIAKALERLPEGMDEAYERILDTIDKKPRAQRELARRILIWTLYGPVPLYIDDLAYAISFEKDIKCLKDLQSSIPTEKNILNACANLISVHQKPFRVVQFAHFSVDEFLRNHQSKYIENLGIGREAAHREIAQTCMTFLTLFPKQKDFLGRYAFNEWPLHLLEGNLNSLSINDQIITLVLSFFGKNPMILTYRQQPMEADIYLTFSPRTLALMFDLPSVQKYSSLHETRDQLKTVHPINLDCIVLSDDKLAYHVAVSLNSIPMAQRLYNRGYMINYSYCAPDGRNNKALDLLRISLLYSVQDARMAEFLLDNGTSMEPQLLHNTSIDPLVYFVKNGDWGVEIFQVLLDRIVDKDRDRLKNALQTAIEGNFFEPLRLLLDKGVNSIILGGRHGNILQVAVCKGEAEVIRQLLEKGVDVNIQGGEYGNALQAAVCMGEAEVIQLLLYKGADVNAWGGKYGTVLQAAILKCKAEVIQLLLDKGADVNIQGGKYGNALQAAAHMGNAKVIQLLLDKGADVTAQGGKYGNALQAAVLKGKVVKIIQQMLDKGADVNIQGGEWGNALQAAAYMGEVEVIQLLLDKGADVNAQGGKYGSALQAAVLKGNTGVIQLLLDKRADVNIQGGEYGNALQAAVRIGEVGVIQLLLDKGANVHAECEALKVAATRGNVKIMQLLLNRGADVNAQGGGALQAAACCGQVEAVQLLLNTGADVNAQGKWYYNALEAAVIGGHLEVIRLLLDQGADVNARGGSRGSALQKAASSGTVEVVQLLLDKGADLHAQDKTHGDALQTAAFLGRAEMVLLLLDKGADANAQCGEYGTALQAAALANVYQVDIIQLLLDKGADVNSQGGKYGNALQAAAFRREIDATRLLLNKGADANAQGGKYGTALQAALAVEPYEDEFEPRGRKKPSHILSVVELLLDHGADITTYIPDSEYGSALNAAKQLWEGDRQLNVLMKLLASRGLSGDEATSNEDTPEVSQDLKEGESGESTKCIDELRISNKNGFGASIHVWRLLVFAFLVFLLYSIIEFWI